MDVGKLHSFWGTIFSGAMLVPQRVNTKIMVELYRKVMDGWWMIVFFQKVDLTNTKTHYLFSGVLPMNSIEFPPLLLRYLITSCSWCICSKEFANSSEAANAVSRGRSKITTHPRPFEDVFTTPPKTTNNPVQNDALERQCVSFRVVFCSGGTASNLQGCHSQGPIVRWKIPVKLFLYQTAQAVDAF